MRKVLLIDLFSGSGGTSLGFSTCGGIEYVPALAIDDNPWAIKSYKNNFPSATALRLTLTTDARVGDAYAIYRKHIPRGNEVVLVASPPCESFSNGASTRRTLSDERNYLFRVVVRWAAAVRPIAVFVENVPQMRGLHDGQFHDELVAGLEALGYRVSFATLNAADYGVPQRRNRLFYLATREDSLSDAPELPTATHSAPPALDALPPYVTVRDAIDDLPPRAPGDQLGSFVSRLDAREEHDRLGYYAAALRPPAGTRIEHHVAPAVSNLTLKRVRSLKPGQAMENLPKELRPKQGFPGSYGRLDPSAPSMTVTANFRNPGSGRYFHYSQERLITMREAARLQGFPDSFRWSGYYKHIAGQIGDAVPPPLAHAFAHSLALQLRKSGVVEGGDLLGEEHCVFQHLKVPEADNHPSKLAQRMVGSTVA